MTEGAGLMLLDALEVVMEPKVVGTMPEADVANEVEAEIPEDADPPYEGAPGTLMLLEAIEEEADGNGYSLGTPGVPTPLIGTSDEEDWVVTLDDMLGGEAVTVTEPGGPYVGAESALLG